ncbi:GntR family transcriptional regulator [Alcaligenaceae bacterium]|nr:GntR family transcriptional regulator [Alcaligenaceae bacterium]
MQSHASISGTSKHAQVSRALLNDIASGKYAVGSMLPSEPTLAVAFGVSRQTIRTALRTLRELGLIEGQQGVGSFVRAAQFTARYAYSFDSAVDLLQYAVSTSVSILSCEEISLDNIQADRLKRRAGERWWQIQTVRSSQQDHTPIASSRILVPYAYGSVLKNLDQTREPIFALIQAQMGVTITEIWQDITATSISETDAPLLKVPAGCPGLSIERRYFGRNGELFEVSRSIHPAETFNYSMRLRLALPEQTPAAISNLTAHHV